MGTDNYSTFAKVMKVKGKARRPW